MLRQMGDPRTGGPLIRNRSHLLRLLEVTEGLRVIALSLFSTHRPDLAPYRQLRASQTARDLSHPHSRT
jgi:hypothetical protein